MSRTSSRNSSRRSAARARRPTPLSAHPRFLSAGNAGPFTLDGTRTYLVGEHRVAVVDPGPDSAAHVQGLVRALDGAREVSVLVTHAHPDHAPAARTLGAALRTSSARVRVLGPSSLPDAAALAPGDVVSTDHGDLIVVDTPGHAREHFAFHWPERRALFAGDLILGKGDTVWVGEYPGCVADYLESLERVRRLRLRVLYPAHGPPLQDPEEALARFEAHRRERIRQVEIALEAHPGADAETLLAEVYGPSLPESVRPAALRSMEALKAHVEGRRA